MERRRCAERHRSTRGIHGLSARCRWTARLSDEGRIDAAHHGRSEPGVRGRLQPLVRARPLLRRLHGVPAPDVGLPLGGASPSQGPPLPGWRHHGGEPHRCRLVRGHLLDRGRPPRRVERVGHHAGHVAVLQRSGLPRTEAHAHEPVRLRGQCQPRCRRRARRRGPRQRQRRHLHGLLRRPPRSRCPRRACRARRHRRLRHAHDRFRHRARVVLGPGRESRRRSAHGPRQPRRRPRTPRAGDLRARRRHRRRRSRARLHICAPCAAAWP